MLFRSGFIAPHQVIGHLLKALVGQSEPKNILEKYGTAGVLESQLRPEKFSKAITKAPWYEKIKDFWNHVHSSFDTATRAAVFDAARKEGAKYGLKGEKLDDFAAMKATEFANFATRGSNQIVNEMGRATPFFNASLNSLDNLYRNATGTHLNEREKRQAREAFRARAAGMAYMTGVYALVMMNDPDYLAAADSDWMNNYFIPTGREGNKWLPVAAGFEPAVMFKTLPELLVRTYTGNLEPAEAAHLGYEAAKEKLLPPIMPLLPGLMSRALFDYDLNLGREIESTGSKNLPPELRSYGASEIGKYISKKFEEGGLGVSPKKIDNLAKGILGGIYDMGISMADFYLASADPNALFDKDEAQKYPILKGFYTSSQNVQKAPQFYEAADIFDQTTKAINHAAAVADTETVKKLLADPEFKAKYGAAPILRKYRDQVNAIRRASENLSHIDMPLEEKKARYSDLLRTRHQIETAGA